MLWTGTEVMDAEGSRKLVHPTMRVVSYPTLQQDVWAGQTIADLSLPKHEIAAVFNGKDIPIFDDGGTDCPVAVMLNHREILKMFTNGYLCLLERVNR